MQVSALYQAVLISVQTNGRRQLHRDNQETTTSRQPT